MTWSIPNTGQPQASSPLPRSSSLRSSRPGIEDLTMAVESSEMIAIQGSDSVPIAVRCFAREAPGSPVIMLHGLQSHSGWFSQSALFISRLGHPVYAIDRRGSGLSIATKGDMDGYERIIDDVRVVSDHARQTHDARKIHIFGHCFGAIPALATACRHPDTVLSIILTSPGIYTYTDLTFFEKTRVMLSVALSGNPYIAIPLKPQDFTDIADIREFIARDPLALREATARFWFGVFRIRRFVVGCRRNLSQPVFSGFSARDHVSIVEKNIRFVCSLPSRTRWLITYESSPHILEFGEDRDVFFRDLALWLSRWP